MKAAACWQLIMAPRTFLTAFLKANGISYEPLQDEPRDCANPK